MSKKWMVYGASGYSAKLIIAEAKKRGLEPVLAGRNENKIKPLAEEYGLVYRVFGLSQASEITPHLEDIDIVLHCAGPFSATSAVMVEACLQAHAHYLDITGEIDVFEHAHSQTINERAKQSNVIICPGVGFDVVPTDCMAASLKQKMPDATELSLAFAGGNTLSPGTAKTTVEALGLKPRVRQNGVIKPVKVRVKNIDFKSDRGKLQTMNISWGDVSTAYYSTGIPNIDVYIPASPGTLKKVKKAMWLSPILRMKWVQNKIKQNIEQKVKGPDEKKRAAQRTVVWGQSKNAKGESITARIETPNGYDVTVTAPLAIIEYLLQSESVVSGSITPSKLMGADFIHQLPDVSEIMFDEKVDKSTS